MKPIGLRPFAWTFTYSRGVGCLRSQRRSRWGRPRMAEWFVDRIVGRHRRGAARREAIADSTAE